MLPMETALVIAVDALPPEIASLRRHLDPSAAAGVPDHITVLYPFLPTEQIDNGLIDRLATVIAQVPAFDYRLVDVRWFGDLVMWLAPDPMNPFAASPCWWKSPSARLLTRAPTTGSRRT